MPSTKFQKIIFAFITVLITVHAYVFYSIYVLNGNTLMSITNTQSVLSAINSLGGVRAFNTFVPIWLIVIVEFILAFSLEIFLGSPLSFKLAVKNFDPTKTHPVIFEIAIISFTVLIMCPTMSFLASFIYYNDYSTFNIFTLLANFIKLVCYNFPFAIFSQIFFIQPMVRFIFKKIFMNKL